MLGMAGQNGLIGSFKEWSDAGKHAKRGEPRFMVNRAKNLMARKPITMRHIKEILRLKHEKKLSVREIAPSCALPASTAINSVIGTVDDDPNKYYPHDRKKKKSSSFSSESSNENIRSLCSL